MNFNNLTELREFFEDVAVQYEKQSRNCDFLMGIKDKEERHKESGRCLRLANRYEDVAQTLFLLQRELGDIE